MLDKLSRHPVRYVVVGLSALLVLAVGIELWELADHNWRWRYFDLFGSGHYGRGSVMSHLGNFALWPVTAAVGCAADPILRFVRNRLPTVNPARLKWSAMAVAVIGGALAILADATPGSEFLTRAVAVIVVTSAIYLVGRAASRRAGQSLPSKPESTSSQDRTGRDAEADWERDHRERSEELLRRYRLDDYR